MSPSYSADLDLVASVVGALSRVEQRLDDVVVDLRWCVAHLQEVWTGRSASAHVETHQRWLEAYGEMRVALAEMRHALDTAEQNYLAAADANTELWRAVR